MPPRKKSRKRSRKLIKKRKTSNAKTRRKRSRKSSKTRSKILNFEMELTPKITVFGRWIEKDMQRALGKGQQSLGSVRRNKLSDFTSCKKLLSWFRKSVYLPSTDQWVYKLLKATCKKGKIQIKISVKAGKGNPATRNPGRQEIAFFRDALKLMNDPFQVNKKAIKEAKIDFAQVKFSRIIKKGKPILK